MVIATATFCFNMVIATATFCFNMVIATATFCFNMVIATATFCFNIVIAGSYYYIKTILKQNETDNKKRLTCMSESESICTHLTPSFTASSKLYRSRSHHVRSYTVNLEI